MALFLRPLSVGDILDGAFALYRRHFATFLAIALIPQIPLIVIWLVLPLSMGGAAAGDTVIGSLAILLLPYTLFAAAIVYAGLVHATMRAYEGENATTGESLRVALKKFIPVAVAGVIVMFAVTFGMFLLIIPGLIFAAMFFAFLPAIVVEGQGPLAALSRSRQLSQGARMRILAVSVLAWCITILPGVAFGAVAGVAGGWSAVFGGAEAVVISGWYGGVVQAGSVVVGALTTPFAAGVLTLLYVDRRARTEAPDLEAAVERLGTTI